ncbi:MAG: hypothetical protein DMF73_13310 [Acidobacteria bacterium]|nr:MAG: hypothetical protein DMF73_13310 [Acidobacteriota bacterium]
MLVSKTVIFVTLSLIPKRNFLVKLFFIILAEALEIAELSGCTIHEIIRVLCQLQKRRVQ